MSSSQNNALNVQYGRASGANPIFDPQQPQIYSNTTNNPANLTALHPDFIPADDVDDADADADADEDVDVPADTSLITDTSAAGAEGPIICPKCGKKCKRPCDLNRHDRTHTRPFKCQIPLCEYLKRGFPTSQELQRHMDDRHSDNPPAFHCSFKGCNYSSKRESNCKQHMEKTHGWKYDRSRHNNQAGKSSEVDETENVNEADDVVAKREVKPDSLVGSPTLSPTVDDYAMHQQQMQQMRQMQFPQYLSASATPMMDHQGDFILGDFIPPLSDHHHQQPAMAATSPAPAGFAAVDGGVVYSNANSPGLGAAATSFGAANTVDAAIGNHASPNNSFVPWESPLTQQEEISQLIQTTRNRLPSQAIAAPVASPSMHAARQVHGSQAQRPMSTSVYPQSIGWFTPGNYHVAQAPLPGSVPGSAVLSDYAAAFSPQTPNLVGTPNLFQQQQQHQQAAPYGSSPHTPLAAAPSLFPPQPMGSLPQTWTVMMPSNTEAFRQIQQKQDQQQKQKLFEEQATTRRQQLRAQAEAAQALDATSQPALDAAAATDRGVKRNRATYESNVSSTAADATNAQVGNGNDDDHDDDDHDDDESEHNGRRPPGPPRTPHSNNETVDDDRMPCPYHLTDPEYFYRDNEERFSPCHTQHRYISTLFRHLGRAAHNLKITENSASSFGVHEAGNRPQRQAGLCRRCWTSFTDETAFNAHVVLSQQCARASRSKREKYWQILRTFCAPPPAPTATPAPAPAPVVVRPPTIPTPAPSGQPTLQPAAPIAGNTARRAQLQVVPSDSARRAAAGPRSPDIKVSPTQQELARAHVLADRSPNLSLQGPVQGRAHPQPRHNKTHHKQNNSVESATLVDADYYVSRTEFQGYTQSMAQRMSALEAIVQRLDTTAASSASQRLQTVAAAGGTSTSSTRPPSSLGPGPARSIASAVIQTDASAHERGSLVREMDRQTIFEEDEDEEDHREATSARGNDEHRRHRHHRQESRIPMVAGDANQMLAGIGEPLRTLSGLSSSSNSSSVLHAPPPASVADENSRVRQQRQEQRRQKQREQEDLEQQQQQQSILAVDNSTIYATNITQQCQSQSQPSEQQLQQFQQQAQQQAQQHEEVETLFDAVAETVPETVADSGYGSNDNKYAPPTGTLPVVHEVIPSTKAGDPTGTVEHTDATRQASQNAIDDIDDGVQPPSMFNDDLDVCFDETNILW
ncbi:hypothetical protein SEUCBS139899_008332 [Sporothrix eucalyptigena]